MNSTLNTWIEEECALMRSEGTREALFLEPETQMWVFVNVLATHVKEFLESKEMVLELREIFAKRGLVGRQWFACLLVLGTEMNQEQMRIWHWLHEKPVTWLSEADAEGRSN